MIHNFLSVFVSVSAALYSCGDDDKFPVKDTDKTVLRWFHSMDCHHQVTEMFVMSNLFTLTFLIVDVLMMLWKRT